MSFLGPKHKGIRDPLSNKIDDGLIVNPPRMAEMGGLSKSKKSDGIFKNKMHIRKPGGTAA